jgi:hypothetical protein
VFITKNRGILLDPKMVVWDKVIWLALPSFPQKYGLIRVFTDIYIIALQNHQILGSDLWDNRAAIFPVQPLAQPISRYLWSSNCPIRPVYVCYDAWSSSNVWLSLVEAMAGIGSDLKVRHATKSFKNGLIRVDNESNLFIHSFI